jgi:hypothetical protein
MVLYLRPSIFGALDKLPNARETRTPGSASKAAVGACMIGSTRRPDDTSAKIRTRVWLEVTSELEARSELVKSELYVTRRGGKIRSMTI